MDDLQILLAKAKDLTNSVKSGRPFAFTSFLNIEEQRVISDYISTFGLESLSFGGYDDAERAVICIYSDFYPQSDDFPIQPLYFKIPNMISVTHRDVLGSLMSLGIKRETLGDIIFFDNICVLFVWNKISEFIINNFCSVKNASVTLELYTENINYQREFEQIDLITSSMRLDCVLSELLSISRTNSSKLIESGMVSLNGYECLKKDKILSFGDIFSVRKKGKFKVDKPLGKTKKDRIKLKIFKYV